MSVTGVPVQLINQTFDFALLCSIKGFWKQYKSTFSLTQLMHVLTDNEQLWLTSGHRNCNGTTYRTSVQLSLQRLVEQAGIIIHRNIVPHLYELVDYSLFQAYEEQLVTALYGSHVTVVFDEKFSLPFMSERSYQLWLLKQHEHNKLNYQVKHDMLIASNQNPCLNVQILTGLQLSYLIKRAVRLNLIPLPPFSSSHS